MKEPKSLFIPFCILVSILLFNISVSAGTFPKENWELASPKSQGVHQERLGLALSYLRSICGKDGTKQTIIIRNGYIIWQGNDVHKIQNVYSCTKSFTSTILGLLIDEGKCSLDTTAGSYLPELRKYYSELSLRHFTTLTSGYESVDKKYPFTPDHPLFKSGTKFHYGDSSMNQFANVLSRIAKEPIEDVFKQRIADPINMNPSEWYWGNFGIVDGLLVNGGSGSQDNGIHISALEFARFGLLFLNFGNWNGKQLISKEWVDRATTPQANRFMEPFKSQAWYRNLIGAYGFNWWVNGTRRNGNKIWPHAPERTAAAQGNYNNYCFIIPEWDMVIVRMGTDKRINNDLYDIFFAKLRLAIKEAME